MLGYENGKRIQHRVLNALFGLPILVKAESGFLNSSPKIQNYSTRASFWTKFFIDPMNYQQSVIENP